MESTLSLKILLLTEPSLEKNVITDASDNRLVNILIDTAFGCTPWTVKDITDPPGRQKRGALALNELLAATIQPYPTALVPANDPMVKINGAPNFNKLNAYRDGVNRPQVNAIDEANGRTTAPTSLLLHSKINCKQGNYSISCFSSFSRCHLVYLIF